MNQQRHRTLLETTTTLPPAEVLAAAKQFFSQRSSIYAAFLEQESATHISMRGQGNEEIVVGVSEGAGGTFVSASTYFFDQQVTRFLASLPTPVPVAVADGSEEEGDDRAALTAGAPAEDRP